MTPTEKLGDKLNAHHIPLLFTYTFQPNGIEETIVWYCVHCTPTFKMKLSVTREQCSYFKRQLCLELQQKSMSPLLHSSTNIWLNASFLALIFTS